MRIRSDFRARRTVRRAVILLAVFLAAAIPVWAIVQLGFGDTQPAARPSLRVDVEPAETTSIAPAKNAVRTDTEEQTLNVLRVQDQTGDIITFDFDSHTANPKDRPEIQANPDQEIKTNRDGQAGPNQEASSKHNNQPSPKSKQETDPKQADEGKQELSTDDASLSATSPKVERVISKPAPTTRSTSKQSSKTPSNNEQTTSERVTTTTRPTTTRPTTTTRAAIQSPAKLSVSSAGWRSFSEMNIGQMVSSDAEVRNSGGQPGSVRVICRVSHFNYDDPVVQPNQKGAAHLHMFLGNTLTDSNSTFDSLRSTGNGTCDGDDLNRSAYWIPALIDTNNNARVPQYSVIYYKSGPLHGQRINELPDGLRMVAGNARAMTADQNKAKFQWYCGFPGNNTETKVGRTIPNCSPRQFLSLKLVFGQCWDGQNLDSPNHRDHVAYPLPEQRCPTSHPVVLPEITYNFHWNNGDETTGGWYLSSDHHGNMRVPGGQTTHGDWFGAWHPEVMKTFVNECNNRNYDCGNGTISRNQKLLRTTTPHLNPIKNIFDSSQAPGRVPIESIRR